MKIYLINKNSIDKKGSRFNVSYQFLNKEIRDKKFDSIIAQSENRDFKGEISSKFVDEDGITFEYTKSERTTKK